ncbi:hypothetical protein DFH08DRAFT_368741 [Mycena albidolilacea]|uniref:Uncharacterized protein n=1 Tax=Mycena albidolilacea TaxID=1033008 RepID=A0AAD7AK48_9AGAR|nr:hypothetical protein DFH08DRAFT_368741 [Mycena albidolilacea]
MQKMGPRSTRSLRFSWAIWLAVIIPRTRARRRITLRWDRKWAMNVELRFCTPEQYFLGNTPDPDFTLRGFNVASLPKLPLYTPSSSPLILTRPAQELVLFVGCARVGKTRLYRQHFQPAGYLHISQDTLQTRDKCVKAVQKALTGGEKCVVGASKLLYLLADTDVNSRQH